MYRDSRRTSSKPTWLVRILLEIIILTGVGLYTYHLGKTTVISPIAEDHVPQVSSILNFMTHEKNPDDLRKLVTSEIRNTWKNYSVYVVDFNSSFTMGINETTIFTAASVNKTPILAALYEEAQRGKVNFDQIVTLQQEDIQDYGTGIIRYDPPGTTYSVKTLAQLMMQKSDNTAAYLLGDNIIGLDVVQNYVNGWGMIQTDMANNKTSNKDMSILFRDIFDGKITNTAQTQEILGFLKGSDFEDRLPALLPNDATVYHKVGTGTGTVHDVGVVVHGKTKYYVGIFTSDITDEEQASGLVAKVSKTIFDFMEKN